MKITNNTTITKAGSYFCKSS